VNEKPPTESTNPHHLASAIECRFYIRDISAG